MRFRDLEEGAFRSRVPGITRVLGSVVVDAEPVGLAEVSQKAMGLLLSDGGLLARERVARIDDRGVVKLPQHLESSRVVRY
jgi:hypothetical protein